VDAAGGFGADDHGSLLDGFMARSTAIRSLSMVGAGRSISDRDQPTGRDEKPACLASHRRNAQRGRAISGLQLELQRWQLKEKRRAMEGQRGRCVGGGEATQRSGLQQTGNGGSGGEAVTNPLGDAALVFPRPARMPRPGGRRYSGGGTPAAVPCGRSKFGRRSRRTAVRFLCASSTLPPLGLVASYAR
jgi:hypothetical protein